MKAYGSSYCPQGKHFVAVCQCDHSLVHSLVPCLGQTHPSLHTFSSSLTSRNSNPWLLRKYNTQADSSPLRKMEYLRMIETEEGWIDEITSKVSIDREGGNRRWSYRRNFLVERKSGRGTSYQWLSCKLKSKGLGRDMNGSAQSRNCVQHLSEVWSFAKTIRTQSQIHSILV